MRRQMLQISLDISKEGNVIISQEQFNKHYEIYDDVEIKISPYQIDTFIRMLREVQEEIEMYQYLEENEVKQ